MLSADYLPNIGGIAGHVLFLSQALQRHGGHNVCVVQPRPGERGGIRATWTGGIRHYHVPVRQSKSRLLGVAGRALDLRHGISEVASVLGGLDILHQHDHRISTLAARWQQEAPWIWTNHSSSFLEDYERPIGRRLVYWMYRPVEGMITVSRELESKSGELWSKKRIAYIPNGVDTEMFHPGIVASRKAFGIADDAFVVLCPRRLTPKNGVIFFAKAVVKLLKEEPTARWTFLLAGTDSTGIQSRDAYVDRVRSLLTPGIARGRVHFLGNVPLDQMPTVNALADVVVIPSLREAVSLSALEAMATGIPVVASNVGGLPEVIRNGETGVLVPPRDPDAIVAALRRLRNSSELRFTIAENAGKLVRSQFSWKYVAAQTEDFYRRCLRGE